MENNNKKSYLNENIPTFSLTMLSSDKGTQNKKYTLDNGEIVKEAIANFYQGSLEVKHFNSVSELDEFIDNLQSNQALTLGIPHRNGERLDSGRVTATSFNEAGAINRTKEYFKFGNTLLFDIDDSDLEIDEVIPALIKIDPNLANAALLVRTSSSYGVHIKGDTNA